MITLPISLKRGRTKELASWTASLIALIPVFILGSICCQSVDKKTRKSVHRKIVQFRPESSTQCAISGLMEESLSPVRQHLRQMRVPYVVLILSLATTALVYF